MRKVQKGFTLVELIVVITILAILATIAFISLQGYSQDAKNSKVNADIRTLASAVETALSDGTVSSMSNIVSGDLSTTVGLGQTTGGDFAATGTTLFGPSDVDMSGSTYDVGTMNFVGLKQNGADFKDNNGNDYIVATAVNGTDDAYYQIAGETTNADGTFTAVVKGNYISSGNANNVAGLISQSGATFTGGVANGTTMATGFYDGL